jgi:uncharacterized membrane protein
MNEMSIVKGGITMIIGISLIATILRFNPIVINKPTTIAQMFVSNPISIVIFLIAIITILCTMYFAFWEDVKPIGEQNET